MCLSWIIILIVFGAGKLSEVGAALGKSIRAFRDSQKDDAEDTPSKKRRKRAVKEAPSAAAPSTSQRMAESGVERRV